VLAKLCGIEQRSPPVFGRAAVTLRWALGHILVIISVVFGIAGEEREVGNLASHFQEQLVVEKFRRQCYKGMVREKNRRA